MILVLAALLAATSVHGSERPFCGVDRWAIKTLQDHEAHEVTLAPVETSIEQLTYLVAPPYGLDHRSAIEKLTLLVDAYVVGYKLEADHDVHVVLKDSAGRTMIAEFPHPDCTLAAPSPLREFMLEARNAFLKEFPVTTKYKAVRGVVRVEVAGAGFFDYEHAQKGAAGNSIELHPVLHFKVTYRSVPNRKRPRRAKIRG